MDDWRLNAYYTANFISYDREYSISRNSGYSTTDNRDIHSNYHVGGIQASTVSHNDKWGLTLAERFIFANYKEQRAESGLMLSKSSDFRNTLSATVQYYGGEKFSANASLGLSIFRMVESGDNDTHISPIAGAQIMWQPSSKVFLRADYRISQQPPAVSALQNYGYFTDSLMYYAGNPSLKPQIYHNFTIAATFFKYLTLEGRYNITDDAIMPYFKASHGVIQSGADTYFTNSSLINGTRKEWSLNTTFTKALGKHWQISASAKVNGYKAKYQTNKVSKTLPEYDWYILYQIMDNTLQFYLQGWMETLSAFNPQEKNWRQEDRCAISISKTLYNNKLQLFLGWLTPLHFVDGKFKGGIISESYTTRYWGSDQFRQNNSFIFRATYRFNGGKATKKYYKNSETIEL